METAAGQLPAIGVIATRANSNDSFNLLTPVKAHEYCVYARHADRQAETGSERGVAGQTETASLAVA